MLWRFILFSCYHRRNRGFLILDDFDCTPIRLRIESFFDPLIVLSILVLRRPRKEPLPPPDTENPRVPHFKRFIQHLSNTSPPRSSLRPVSLLPPRPIRQAWQSRNTPHHGSKQPSRHGALR